MLEVEVVNKILLFLILISIAGCSSVIVQYKDVKVSSNRFFMSMELYGLDIIAPDGTRVKLEKRIDNPDTEILNTMADTVKNLSEKLP